MMKTAQVQRFNYLDDLKSLREMINDRIKELETSK